MKIGTCGFSGVSIDHSFWGNKGLEETWLITVSSQRKHYNFPTYCCLIQLDSINSSADGFKKRTPVSSPGTGIVTDWGLSKEMWELFFPCRHPFRKIPGLPLPFSLICRENDKPFPLYKEDYLNSIGWFWWHSCVLTSWEHIFLLYKFTVREENNFFIIHMLTLEICPLTTRSHESCLFFFFPFFFLLPLMGINNLMFFFSYLSKVFD